MTERIFNDFTPSNLRRRELCPGSCRMERGLGALPEPELELKSRHLHDLIDSELVLIYGFEAVGAGADYESVEDAECIRKMIGKLYEITRERTVAEGRLQAELSFQYLGQSLFRGKTDLLLVASDRVIVVNWRISHQPRPAKASTVQGAAYALAAMQMFGREIAEVHYYNPLLDFHESHVYDDRYAIISRIAGIIAGCHADDAALVPGREQCLYCRAAGHGTCPGFVKNAELAAVEAEKLLPMPSLDELPELELCRLYHTCKMTEKLLGRVEERIRAVCDESGQCGSLEVKTISGGREILDIEAALARLNGLFTPGEFLEFCTLSASRLEKGYADKLKASGRVKTEKEGKAACNEVMRGLITDKAPRRMIVEAC